MSEQAYQRLMHNNNVKTTINKGLSNVDFILICELLTRIDCVCRLPQLRPRTWLRWLGKEVCGPDTVLGLMARGPPRTVHGDHGTTPPPTRASTSLTKTAGKSTPHSRYNPLVHPSAQQQCDYQLRPLVNTCFSFCTRPIKCLSRCFVNLCFDF